MDSKVETRQEISNHIVANTAVFSRKMTVTGDIVFEGSLELMGNVIGNIDILGKMNVTGGIYGNSKASGFYLENARVEGEINSSGNVEIGRGSIVVGNIFAESAVIDGAVEGDIDVHGPVLLDASAVVLGNIKSKSLQINNGALLQGICSQSYAQVDPSIFFEETEVEILPVEESEKVEAPSDDEVEKVESGENEMSETESEKNETEENGRLLTP